MSIPNLKAEVVWQEGFEGDVTAWTIEGTSNIWEFGAPTSGPGTAHSGGNVAGTRLASNYPNNANTRLVSPEFQVPSAFQNPKLRYWYWYETAFGSHYGHLQIRISGGAWQDLPERISDRSGNGAWMQRIVDLKPYAGLNVQIGFQFVSTSSTTAAGWFVDDVSLETGAMEFTNPQDFETTLGDWSVENGVWQWGVPTAANGPTTAHSGTKCVGTILSANYPNGADARLVSPEFVVPSVNENPRFKYWNWYITAFPSHYGQLQVRIGGGAWQDVGGEQVHSTGGSWAQRILDLRPYAGQTVQLGFRLITTSSTTAAGWFVDSISLETGPHVFDEVPGFEAGFGNWSSEGGVWQVGPPTAPTGPTPRSGTNVAGTVLAGNYPNSVDARLVSPEFTVPSVAENPRFRFWQWHDTPVTSHYGQLQIRTSGGAWQDVPTDRVHLQSLGWSQRMIDLRPYTGQPVQIGFRFVATTSTTRPGWYIDDAAVETGPMVLSNPDGFENGFGDWSSQGGLWQIGVPTAADGPQPFSGNGVAGTILGGNYFNNTDARLVSPEFVVPALEANPTLSFRHWYYTAFSSHNGRVQISTNGTTWTDISPVFNGVGTNWTHQLIDLNAYADQKVRIAFSFVASTSTTRPGWYIDDFEIASDTLDPVANQIIPELVPFNIPLVTRGSNLRFNFGGSAPTGAVVGPVTPEFAWTPSEQQGPGNYENIIIEVTQPDNWLTPVDRQSFAVTVNEINLAPTLQMPATQTVNELASLNVSVSATDPDFPTNTLAFSLVNPPEGMTINPGTGHISWTPTELQGPATNVITVMVTDLNLSAVNANQLTDTNTFTIIVREVNTPPTLTVPPVQSIDELGTLNVSASASDADWPANALTFSLVNPPAGMTINPNNGSILWTPTEAQGPTNATITVRVTDSSPNAVNEQQLNETKTFTVTVNEVNLAPSLILPASRSIDELTSLNVSATATDSDLPANPLTFSLISPPAGMSINPASGAISWTPSEIQGPSTNVITVVVTDTNAAALVNRQWSVTNSFTVTVNEVNHAPQLTVPSNQAIDEQTTLTLFVSAMDSDLPANPLTFTLLSPPSGMTINAASGAISWTPSEAQGPSTNVITVVVTDTNAAALANQQLSMTNSFTVTVNEVNLAPSLGAIPNQNVTFGFVLSVQATATDEDAPANTLAFSLLTAPTGMIVDTNGMIHWTPAQNQVGIHPVTLRVADNGIPLLSATQSFQVTVTGEASSLAISRLSGNLMQITITGDVGLDYELLMSTNLSIWSPLLQFNLSVSPYPYIDPGSASQPLRFYRLRRISD